MFLSGVPVPKETVKEQIKINQLELEIIGKDRINEKVSCTESTISGSEMLQIFNFTHIEFHIGGSEYLKAFLVHKLT